MPDMHGQATSSSTNAKYNPLGNVIDLETNVSIGIKITMSQIVVESDLFFREYMEGLATGNLPVWDFQGSLLGRNGSEVIVYLLAISPSRISRQGM